jgi:Zn-dependent metalloprotease
MKRMLCLLLSGCLAGTVFGQQKPDPFAGKKKTLPPGNVPAQLIDGSKNNKKPSYNTFTKPFSQFTSSVQRNTSHEGSLKIVHSEKGLPVWIEGKAETESFNFKVTSSKKERQYLNQVKDFMQIEKPDEELVLTQTIQDNLHHTHYRFRQSYKGIKVWGSEVIVHEQAGTIQSLSGRYFPTPSLTDIKPSITASQAINTALANAQKNTPFRHLTNVQKKMLKIEESESELIIYHINDDIQKPALVWHLTIRPNLIERWEYFMDAQTGEILEKYPTHCTIDGPRTATATDLNGVSRTVNTYEVSGSFYMIDASKSMFNASRSTFPGDVVGGIYTVDANNTTGSTLKYVTSTNNSWNNPKAISSHFNASLVFDYYKNTHGRNSIDGSGGTIYSVINVSDESGKGLDNAYWNGKAMFYGNGRTAFKPLAGSLDVAAHEITHGVIQNSANLEYKGQSGAINESFADVFGVLLDRNDFLIGEDIILNNSFPSGALRSLSNPNQGGTSDPGYQPKTMSQFVNTTQDNGGVHINSGIPNYAFFLFSTASGMSLAKSEKVYYRALTTYLTSKSQFLDLRIAIVKSAEDLFGAGSLEVNAAKAAFDAVGIVDASSTPTSSTIPYSLNSNTGGDFILAYDSTLTNKLFVINVSTSTKINLSTSKLISKPSVTDDGSTAVYVTTDGKIRKINLSGTPSETIVDNQTIWSSVAIAKDGSKLAATTQNVDTSIFVFNFANQKWTQFKLYNPTQAGVKSKGVLYADALDWDHTGEYVMYDSFNQLGSNSGDEIEFWDIGFLKVWDNDKNDAGSGEISKLFSSLPQDVSVGNPVFSKNSPYVIAFDYIDNFNAQYSVYSYNFDIGKGNFIATETVLGYPSFSRTDDRILFSGKAGSTNALKYASLKTDKITINSAPQGLYAVSGYGVWFGNGSRNISPMNMGTLSGSAFCGDNTLNITFAANYPYVEGNVFTVQLSNASGNFTSPTVIGTFTGTGNGNTLAKIPSNVTSGTGYRIRVVSSNPALFGNNNGTNLTLNPKTPTATISVNGIVLTSNVATGNQWLRNGNAIPGATATSFVASIPGNYTVQQSSAACGNTISNVIVISTTAIETEIPEGITVFPNPATDQVSVRLINPSKNWSLRLYNMVGKSVLQQSQLNTSQTDLDVKSLSKGVYVLHVKSGEQIIKKKLVIQ